MSALEDALRELSEDEIVAYAKEKGIKQDTLGAMWSTRAGYSPGILSSKATAATVKAWAKAYRAKLRAEEARVEREAVRAAEAETRAAERAEAVARADVEQATRSVSAVEAIPEPRAEDSRRELPSTPTIAPQRDAPLVALHDVVLYLEKYRFISRYNEEKLYEIELAGALRERFGHVIRQNPVAVPNRRLTIDLDVGGIGIEVKYDVGATAVRNALQQLIDYRTFYGENLILLLIATHGADGYKADIRKLGVVVIEK